MASAAVAAYGTLLKMGDGTTPTEIFATIAEVKDITGPSLTTTLIEVTNHDSPGAIVERIASFKDGGTVTFNVNFLPANATQSFSAGLLQKWWDRESTNFKLVFPTTPAVEWLFSAVVTNFTPSAPVAGVLGAAVTLTVSGNMTLA
jgi:hypothetical protein